VLLAGVAVLMATGFQGISDDDAARTLIAWDFARDPSIDPTRSSWLPLHPMLVGAALALTRELWWTPRLVSLAGAVGAVCAAAALTRQSGAGPRAAAMAALAGVTFPWSTFCAWAPAVPEMPCTALLLAGVAVAMRENGEAPSLPRALAAGTLLSLACGHRYEAWFAGTGVLAAAGLRWRRSPRAIAALALGLAMVPFAWLWINHARSGDALDFVTRVTRYRAAHEALPPLPGRFARYPLLLLRHSGALALIALYGVVRLPRRVALPVGAAAGVVAWLVLTDVRGGGATHHVARSLLPAAWMLAVAAAATLDELWRAKARLRPALVVVGLLALGQQAAGLVDVPREVAMETIAAGRIVSAMVRDGRCFVVEAGRLDFLWLELASGVPERAVADRAFGGPAPVARELEARARPCGAAAVHSEGAASVLQSVGFREASRHGAWRVLRRDGSSPARVHPP
jgi:hypothetical protein